MSRVSLAPASQRFTFRRGDEILAQEGDGDHVYRVISGSARAAHLCADGRRQIGDFYYPGDLFGFEAPRRRRFAVEAVTTLTVVRYAREDAGAMIAAAARAALERAQDHLLLLGEKTARDRVQGFLAGLAARGCHELPMGRQDIADYLHLTMETVSRMLTELRGARAVEFEGSRRFRLAA